MRFLTSRYTFVRSAIVKGAWWWLGALASLSAIVGGTTLGYVQFASHRPLIVGLGVGALFLLILEALYREYGSNSEAEQRNRLLQVLAAAMESGRAAHDVYGRGYGDWWTFVAGRIDELDAAYAAEFRMVGGSLEQSLEKLQDIMRAVRAPGSHLARRPR